VGMCMTNGGLLAAATWGEWILQPSSWLVILQVAGGLGFVIFVHELGHFLVAKACGVKCEKFYLGFDVGGLKILSFTWGETEYGIGALPLGGYVKMLGQDDNPTAAAAEAQRAKAVGPGHALTSGDLPPEPGNSPNPEWDPRSYPAQSVPKRMAIISAGVIMNVIFAVLMASLAYGLGVREMTCTISSVRTGGVAWRAGLRTGDEIVKIGDRTDPIFNDLRHGVTVGNVKKGIAFTIHRPSTDATWTVLLKPDSDLGAPTIGVTSPFSLTLPADFGKGLPGAAGRAKPALEPGDTIRTIDGVTIETYAELYAALVLKQDAPVTLGVDRIGAAAEAITSVEIVLPPQEQRITGVALTAGSIVAVQDGSPAADAGLEQGDEIITVDGQPLGDPLTLDDRLRSRAGQVTSLTVRRQGHDDRVIDIVPREATWRDDVTTGMGPPASVSSLGIALPVLPTVAAVEADSPADRTGIKVGDILTSVTFVIPGGELAEEKVPLSEQEPNWPVVMAVLQQVPEGTKLRLDLKTASGEARSVEFEPVASADQFVVDRGLVFEPVYRDVKARTVAGAFQRGLQKTGEDLTLVYAFLGKLWSNRISPRLLGGPIEIAKQAGKSAEEGFGRLLLFLTMLSANLAVVNFLPIPVLDGGHMVFLLYELVFRKPPSEGVVAVLSYLGLALILSLMLFVFGLDVGLIPRR